MITVKKCNIPYMTTSGERIKQRRKELKMSQATLGKQCGITHTAVGLWENGQNKIGGENLIKAANALGVTPEWIINGNTKKAQKADDLKFADWVIENIVHLTKEERKDIELLINHAKARRAITDKYK